MKDYSKIYLEQKPYKDWSKSDIYYGIIHYRRAKGLPKLERGVIIPTFGNPVMRRDFLKMVGSKNGKDIYAMNLKAIEELTDESLEIMFAKYKNRGREKRKPRYKMEFIATWEDRYEIVQEDVDIEGTGFGKWFTSGIDGHRHRVDERGAKIIEVLYER